MRLEFILVDVLERLLATTCFRPEKVGDGWGWLFERQVGQAFIKSSMGCNFCLVSLAVTPEKVSSEQGCVTWKDAFSSK